MGMKPKVFLCYDSQDQEKVSEIYQYLAANGCDPWMDKEKLLPGHDWEYQITLAIEHADYFIPCLSSRSIDKRGYVQKELKKGLYVLESFPEGKIFVIPIRLDDCKIPRSLSHQHWLNWFEVENRTKLLEAIDVVNSEIEELRREFFPEKSLNINTRQFSLDWLKLGAKPFQYFWRY
jgi:hypothetical protein